MKNSQLNRALKLVHRTGDRLVVFDQDTDNAYAILDLDEYENLLDMPSGISPDFDDDCSCDSPDCHCHDEMPPAENFSAPDNLANESDFVSDDAGDFSFAEEPVDLPKPKVNLNSKPASASNPIAAAANFSSVGALLKNRFEKWPDTTEVATEEEWKKAEWGNGENNSPVTNQVLSADIDEEAEQEIAEYNSITTSASNQEEVSLSDIPHEDEEETFLLEPVE